MNPSTFLSDEQWAEHTFGSVRLGDPRRTERTVVMACTIAHDPAASLLAQRQEEAAHGPAGVFLTKRYHNVSSEGASSEMRTSVSGKECSLNRSISHVLKRLAEGMHIGFCIFSVRNYQQAFWI